MKAKVSLADIAVRLGVSTSLVSYVLNNKEQEKRISPEIARKIRETARELNYLPNQIARSLKTSKTNTIGLLVANITYRFTTGVASVIETKAREAGYTVIFGSSEENPEKFNELVDVFINRQVDGLILVPVAGAMPTISRIMDLGIPFVLVDRNFSGVDTSYVLLDNYKAVSTALGYLRDKGIGKVGMINYDSALENLRERNRAFLEFGGKKNAKANAKRLQLIDERAPGSIAAAIRELVSEQQCDGLLFATDRLTIEGLKVLRDLKLKVPKDMAVYSFDESESFELYAVPITHGRQPLEQMGEAAMESLLALMKGQEPSRKIVLEAELVSGKSCRE